VSDTALAGRRGAASVEYLALASLIGLLVAIAIAALIASPPTRGDRELGEMLARRIACPPRYPVPCGRNPLALAYGFPLGKLVRYLAPEPAIRTGERPVDFRYCRRPSCAAPGLEPGLTASGRRVTEFTSAEDLRPAGPVRITYWLYRPGLGWQRIERTAGDAEIAAAAGIRLSVEDDPALVPLETLPGRDHYRFPPGEQPPWQWQVHPRPAARSGHAPGHDRLLRSGVHRGARDRHRRPRCGRCVRVRLRPRVRGPDGFGARRAAPIGLADLPAGTAAGFEAKRGLT
jgi:hypothetical protein